MSPCIVFTENNSIRTYVNWHRLRLYFRKRVNSLNFTDQEEKNPPKNNSLDYSYFDWNWLMTYMNWWSGLKPINEKKTKVKWKDINGIGLQSNFLNSGDFYINWSDSIHSTCVKITITRPRDRFTWFTVLSRIPKCPIDADRKTHGGSVYAHFTEPEPEELNSWCVYRKIFV